LSLNSQE
jgi:hypothetical protein